MPEVSNRCKTQHKQTGKAINDANSRTQTFKFVRFVWSLKTQLVEQICSLLFLCLTCCFFLVFAALFQTCVLLVVRFCFNLLFLLFICSLFLLHLSVLEFALLCRHFPPFYPCLVSGAYQKCQNEMLRFLFLRRKCWTMWDLSSTSNIYATFFLVFYPNKAKSSVK